MKIKQSLLITLLFYRKHLNALKENNIMTQIENPERRAELRQWVWLILMRSAENK